MRRLRFWTGKLTLPVWLTITALAAGGLGLLSRPCFLASAQPQHARCLVYHHLVPERFLNPARKLNGAILPAEDFAAHMQYLASHGYHVITLTRFENMLDRKQAIPPRTVMITFDDGYESVYRYAFPVLKKYRFPATVFLITSLVGKSPPDPDPAAVTYLTWSQIRAMYQSGLVDFESHTHDMHRYLPGRPFPAPALVRSPPAQVLADLEASRRAIFAHLGYLPTALAYPYGAYTAETARLAHQAGFRLGFATRPGPSLPPDLQRYALPRVLVFPHTPWFAWRHFVLGEPLPIALLLFGPGKLPELGRILPGAGCSVDSVTSRRKEVRSRWIGRKKPRGSG
ncbi:MAG: polysaccharide deacetylase family protein [Bacillota bacterium]|nr:polysaccharide deacetylase family protein [Bacillota bacterium]